MLNETGFRWFKTSVVGAMAILGVAAIAEAGPPLICHQFDAGSARLLPWAANGSGWNSPDPGYDISRLTADTLALLTPEAPVLARMEIMRRATIYAGKDERAAAELLTAIMARAQRDTARGRDPLAW